MIPHPGPRSALRAAAPAAVKKHAKKAAKKHAKKHAGHDHPPHHPPQKDLARAYFHLQRSSAIMAVLSPASVAVLKSFFDQGSALYRQAHAASQEKAATLARTAAELPRAVEHLAAAALCAGQPHGVPGLPLPTPDFRRDRDHLAERLAARPTRSAFAKPLRQAALGLLNRSQQAEDQQQPHLAHEFLKAAEALHKAMEAESST